MYWISSISRCPYQSTSAAIWGHTVGIYTDSWYVFGVIHDSGMLWKQKSLPTSSGTPIHSGPQVDDLLMLFSSLLKLLPSKLTHTKRPEPKWVSRESPSDFHVKAAATKSIKIMALVDEVHCTSAEWPLVARLLPSWSPGNVATVCSRIREIKMGEQWL